MPVCAAPPNPSLAYHTLERPATYGFMARYINEIEQQVYSESRAERARRTNAQRNYYEAYDYRVEHVEPNYTQHTETSRRRPRPSAPQVAFPTPETYPVTAGAPTAFPRPQMPSSPHNYTAVPQSRPGRRVRFQSPHFYDPYTPAAEYATPVAMPEPAPYGPIGPPSATTPTRVYQALSQARPYPDVLESAPLFPPSGMCPAPPAYGSSTTSTYGDSTRSSRSSSTYCSSRPNPNLHAYPAPPVVTTTTASKYDTLSSPSRTSSTLSSSLGQPIRGRAKYSALQKASERMEIFMRVTKGWLDVLRRNHAEKLTPEEVEIASLVNDLHQRAKTALNTISVIVATVQAYEGIQSGPGSPFASDKLQADTHALATLGTSIHHKLGSLVRRLKRADENGAETAGKESSPGCCLMNVPSCLAGLYLKKKLFLFTSLLKANKEQDGSEFQEYSKLELDEPQISALIDLLYAEVQRTYNTATKALAGFESSLRIFQLSLHSGLNVQYYLQ